MTTIAVDDARRARLRALQQARGLPSADATVAALLDAHRETATARFSRRREEVLSACSRHRIRRLVAFGSRAWGIPLHDSDLDLVATFERTPDLWRLEEAQEALTEAFACPVDLHTREDLRPVLRERVDREGVAFVLEG